MNDTTGWMAAPVPQTPRKLSWQETQLEMQRRIGEWAARAIDPKDIRKIVAAAQDDGMPLDRRTIMRIRNLARKPFNPAARDNIYAIRWLMGYLGHTWLDLAYAIEPDADMVERTRGRHREARDLADAILSLDTRQEQTVRMMVEMLRGNVAPSVGEMLVRMAQSPQDAAAISPALQAQAGAALADAEFAQFLSDWQDRYQHRRASGADEKPRTLVPLRKRAPRRTRKDSH